MLGFVVYAPAWVSARYANLVTADMSPNSLYHLATVLSLVWLTLFTQLEIGNIGMFLTGAALIIGSGMRSIFARTLETSSSCACHIIVL